MDRVVMKILVLVAAIPGENPGRRKGKVFLATLDCFFAQKGKKPGESTKSKSVLTLNVIVMRKGKGVNILLPFECARQRKCKSDACG